MPFVSLPPSRSLTMDHAFRSVVTDSDRNIISQFLLDAENEMKEYQLEISRLKASVLLLENKREGLRKKMDHYRSLLSPIHRMPTEILARIFSYYCHDEHILRVTTRPLKLSQVCARWNNVVQSTPRLWSYLKIDFELWEHSYGPERLKDAIQLCINRSLQVPLTISLVDTGLEVEEWMIPTLDLLVQHSERWESLTLEALSLLAHPIFSAIKGSIHSLKHLHIGANHWHMVELDLFHTCPSLTSLHLEGPELPIDPSSPFPWPQIRSLELTAFSSEDALSFLTSCPDIEQATFCLVGDGGMRYDSAIQPVTIKVRSLDVETYTEEGDADFIFRYCTLPELTSLRIVGIDRDARWSWIDDHIPDFLSRSCCSITELVLSELPIADWQTASLLRQLPTLKSLQLDEFLGPTNKIITPLLLQPLTLNYEPTPTHFLPELASLSLKVYENGLDHDMLVRALTSRWLPDAAYAAGIGVSCLKSITLTILGTPSPASNSALSTLDCLKDVGAKVVVEYKELQPS